MFKRQKIFACTLALTALFTGFGHDPADARNQLKLRGTVSITDEVVRIGDLFENAGTYADRPVFRAPAPGKSGTLTASRISHALRNHGLQWRNSFRIHEVNVSRKGVTLSLDAIGKAVRREIMALDSDNEAGEMALEFDRDSRSITLPADMLPTPTVLHTSYDKRSGRFVAVVSGPGAEGNRYRRKYLGRAVAVTTVPVLTRRITRGERISREDLAYRKLPQRRVPASTVLQMENLIGQAARRTLRPDIAIRTRDIEKPRVVRKNAIVTVVFKTAGLVLSARGRAQADGALGDIIPVLNQRSKRTIDAEITGPDSVRASVTTLKTSALIK